LEWDSESVRIGKQVECEMSDETLDQRLADLQRQRDAVCRSINDLETSGLDNPQLLALLRTQQVEVEQQIQTLQRGVAVGKIEMSGGNLFIITGDGVKVPLPGDQPEALLPYYYRSLANECSRLPLGVVRPVFAQPGQGEVSLKDVYTDLDVLITPPKDEGTPGRIGLRLESGEQDARRPLLEAMIDPTTPRLVLLGDPGSGKTTFVNYLTYRLAAAHLEKDYASLPEILSGRVVVRLMLRYAARCLPLDAAQGQASMLWDALYQNLAGSLGESGAKVLMQYLQPRLGQSPGGVILLDGLDEVPESGRRRRCLVDAITRLIDGLSPDSRILLTARPYAYQDKAWQLPGFQVAQLAPFTPEQVESFVGRWYRAVRPTVALDVEDAERRAGQLSDAIQERPYLADLASRPLLLTLMAALHTSGGQLPEDRADLYEESVKLLLTRWERGRLASDETELATFEQGLGQALRVGEDRIRSALEKLAFRTHQRQRELSGQDQRADMPADIPSSEVIETFSEITPDDVHPRLLLKYLETRAGLLIARGEGVYAFPHRSFQEYLAACHLASDPNFAFKLRELAWQDMDWWREVCLLGIGKARQGKEGPAIAALSVLLPDSYEEAQPVQGNHWRMAVLVGQALDELRLEERGVERSHYAAIHKRVVHWLEKLVAVHDLPSRLRFDAGELLGRLGDPRPGICRLFPPLPLGEGPGVREVPRLDWVRIPAGPFRMGSPDEMESAYPDERPQHTLELPDFYLSRCLVTNAQYRPFVEGGGYEDRRYWTEHGWDWRRGEDSGLVERIRDDDLRQRYTDWLAERPAERRGRPFWWGHPEVGAPNRPVVGVSWYEALAYGRWLEAQLSALGDAPLALAGLSEDERAFWRRLKAGELRLGLPSEAEWEKAARGPLPAAPVYPWGDDPDPARANTEKTGLNTTSAVGVFPGGAGVYGVQDLIGNVWEWTRSRWGDEVDQPKFGYPYHPADGREDLDSLDFRVLRGGSWYNNQTTARCGCRDRGIPDSYDQGIGFRMAASLAVPES
jgi:formylglycine-generating enzyme required for sulfatase activity